MRTIIEKTDKARVWAWRVIDNCGDTIAAGYTKTKQAAEIDSTIWTVEQNAREAREAGRVVRGDKLEIKPEWQDPGDEKYDFFATETQLKGQRFIKMRAYGKATGNLTVGIQEIMIDHIASHTPNTTPTRN